MSKRMRSLSLAIPPATLAAFLLAASPAPAADDTKVKGATQQVETGAKKIGDGEVGKGAEETAKGVGNTVEVRSSRRRARPRSRRPRAPGST